MATSDSVPFRELLRRRRLARALSQEALAERAGLSVDAIRALERGRRAAPRADTMTRLVEALELGASDRDDLITAATTQSEAAPSPQRHAAPAHALPTGGFLGSLPTGKLIGRAGEMASIAPALDAAERGEGRAVFLAGAAGVGKTRLGQEVTARAADRGFMVLAGRCYAGEQMVPYYPFLEALGAAYEAAPDSVRTSATERWPYLGVLLPNYLAPPPADGGSDEQQRVLFAAGAFLAALSRETPLLFLLDDLQWADSASLRLLQYLIRQGRSSRLLILTTYRDAEIADDHALYPILRDLGREGLLERMTIAPLDQPATRELMADIMPATTASAELAARIFARTEGNPFFVSQLMRALVERGEVDRADRDARPPLDEIELPETIRAVIGQRVERLGAGAQQLLHEASVLGDTFAVGDLAAMTGAGDDDLDDGLVEAERSGLIRERARDVYAFDHGLTRQALYQGLASRRRRRLHRRAGEAIASLPKRRRETRSAELAWHFMEGDEPVRALPHALAAGDRAEAMFAHEEAEAYYRMALRLAEESGEDDAHPEIEERLAAPLHRSGRYQEALEALERAAAAYERRGELQRLMPVIAEIAGAHGNRGTPQEGLDRVLPLLPQFESAGPSAGLIYLYASYGALLFVLGRAADHVELARHSEAMADTLLDTRARAVAKAQLGLALMAVRRREEGRLVLEEAMALAEEADDPATLGHALNNVAYVAELRGELDRSIALFEQGLALARRLGNPAQAVFMLTALARNELYRGTWERAQEHAEEAIQLGRELGASWVAPYPILGHARILLVTGEWKNAQRELEEGLALAETNADRQAREHALRMLAELDLLQGRPDDAAGRLASLGISGEDTLDDGSVPLLAMLTLARVRAALGHTEEAAALMERIIHQAEEAGELLVVADALPVLLDLQTVAQSWEQAERLHARIRDLHQTIQYPYARAQALDAAGRLFAARGMIDRSAAAREEADAMYLRLGAWQRRSEALH